MITDIEDFQDKQETDVLFDCEYTSVDAVINQITVFTGVKDNVQTDNGLRTLIAYGEGNNRSAFFTDSKRLKEVVLNPLQRFPFRAIIKVVRFGMMYGFRFTSPSCEITQDDVENFEHYKRTKFRKR